MKNFKKIISIILMITLGVNCIESMNTFAADYNFDDTEIFNTEYLEAEFLTKYYLAYDIFGFCSFDKNKNVFLNSFECYLAYNIFEILSINENKRQILNAFNELVKKNQPYIEGITFELWRKFTAFLSMILDEAGAPIDEINTDDFIYREDNSLNFTFIFIINSYIRYIEKRGLIGLSVRFDIDTARKSLNELKKANDYFATHKK